MSPCSDFWECMLLNPSSSFLVWLTLFDDVLKSYWKHFLKRHNKKYFVIFCSNQDHIWVSRCWGETKNRRLAYHITLISRICFTNYRNIKSSLLPLWWCCDALSCLNLEVGKKGRTYDSNYVTPPGKIFDVLSDHKKLMWQIHGNLSFNLHRKGWFIRKFFYNWTSRQNENGFDRNRQMEANIQNLLIVFPQQHMLNLLKMQNKSFFPSL